jgi:Fe-S cluster biogenesis protein NfuA
MAGDDMAGVTSFTMGIAQLGELFSSWASVPSRLQRFSGSIGRRRPTTVVRLTALNILNIVNMKGHTAMRAQVEECIEVIRPALQADGGDIQLRDVDEATGLVTVSLVGACGTCPASSQTLKAGIERIMRDRVDGVTEVVAV